MNVPRTRINRTPILYLMLGFVVGVILSRNSAPMSHPEKGAVVMAMILGGFVLWRGANRGRAEATAVAVANATAIATANAKAEASAVAQQAVTLIFANRDEITFDEALKVLKSDSAAQAIESKDDASSFMGTRTTRQQAARNN